jgi:hypothetical protein
MTQLASLAGPVGDVGARNLEVRVVCATAGKSRISDHRTWPWRSQTA